MTQNNFTYDREDYAVGSCVAGLKQQVGPAAEVVDDVAVVEDEDDFAVVA